VKANDSNGCIVEKLGRLPACGSAGTPTTDIGGKGGHQSKNLGWVNTRFLWQAAQAGGMTKAELSDSNGSLVEKLVGLPTNNAIRMTITLKAITPRD
jgi:hypothetical protein